MEISKEDLDDLTTAKSLLEHAGLAVRLSSLIGTPIQKGFDLLPANWSDIVAKATRKALEQALNFAIITLDKKNHPRSSDRLHKMFSAATGAVGGAFGLPALGMELPVSTTVMLRSIADIARSEGEPMASPEARLACLAVFALGGSSTSDDGSDTGYFAVRLALGKAISEAAQHIAGRGLTREGAPAIARLIALIAARFGIVVSEKVAAQAVPVIGAVGGALINTLFINHFQDMARGHFIVRRLERKYSSEIVKNTYQRIKTEP
jgi:hypothetical protein